jgi:hypothetical protein
VEEKMGNENLEGFDGLDRDDFVELEPPNGAPTDPHGGVPPSSGPVDAPLGEDGSAAQAEPEGPAADSEKWSARDISDPTPVELEFEDGPRRDPLVEAFKRHSGKVQRLEEKIVCKEAQLEGMASAEAELEQEIKSLVKEQILEGYRGWQPVAEGKVSQDVVDTFLREAGSKRHGNDQIPCSPYMRAIVLQNEPKGTQRYKRKMKRAATYASAIDYGVRVRMTEDEFGAELRHPPTRGERHGIELLADLGRAARRGARDDGKPVDPPADLPYRVDDELSRIPVGEHLMLVRSDGDTVMGGLLTVPESVMRQVLAADLKSRSSTDRG